MSGVVLFGNDVGDKGDYGGGQSIFELARGRWLTVPELERLLSPQTTPLTVSPSPPSHPPPSGTLLLYDRSTTRNYKHDGYDWVKRRNSSKIREDHVKLKVKGKERVAGCYVHCSQVETIHRRAYHLIGDRSDGNGNGGAVIGGDSSAGSIGRRAGRKRPRDDDDGAGGPNAVQGAANYPPPVHSASGDGGASNYPPPVSSIGGKKTNNDSTSGGRSDLVLVHYLDTDEARRHSAKLAALGLSSELRQHFG